MRISGSEETLSQAPNLCPRNNHILCWAPVLPCISHQRLWGRQCRWSCQSLKKKKTFVQLYPLLKEKGESDNRGLLLVMGFSNVSAHKKHLGSLFLLLLLYLIFWLCCAACGVPVPQLGIEPVPPVLEAQSLNHWTAREVPSEACYTIIFPAAIPKNANSPV